ncbi:MAG: hypothetical protein UX60_C0014G0010 [Berkelbacteria bacterium GW2011_GWA2_46_7]|uniref:Uncharacterized protein n=1 Tax=Berkelbacteria bacterium GW2011_GWA2_46_7 TaxID=1618335 RepID=A0A0G1QFY3_9BACT|nr:MAG: hypothetical protein UX60_C0014G0010 [Berkelbacteria bacterium GW2011_GWA2_46_7]
MDNNRNILKKFSYFSIDRLNIIGCWNLVIGD